MEESETESGSNQLETDICQVDRIAHILTSAPHIVKTVLSYLSAKDISTCARVCRLWADTVKVLKQRRKTLSWTCLDCEDSEADSIHQTIKDFIQTLYSQPALVFMFCQTDLYDNPIRISSPTPTSHRGRTRYSRASKRKKAEIGEYVKSVLPKGCDFVGMTTDGIVGTSTDLSKRFEYEGRKGISFLALPQLEGVIMDVFTVDVYYAVTENLDIEFLTQIPKEKNVKLILFFSDNPDWSHTLGYSMLRQYPQAAIAGGYVDNLILAKPCHFPDSEALPSLMCVAFSGPNIQVATVVVKETVQTEEGFEKEVKRLKSCNLPEENSFAFMFACVGRGCGLYDKEDVETSVFKKYFPKTSLIGFFGNGEVGFNSFPNAEGSRNSGDETTKDKIQIFHGYTTILCLVSVS